MTVAITTEYDAELAQQARVTTRRALILANPRAGALSVREFLMNFGERGINVFRTRSREAGPPVLPSVLTPLAEAAARAGLQANVEAVPSPARLPELVRTAEAEGFDTIVAVGGDGTVRTVAQALIGSSLRLGILPMGSANNVAHALGIPFDLDGAMRVVAESAEQRIDVGRIGSEYFLEAAGVGLFADVLDAFGPEEPRRYQILRILNVVSPILWNLRAHNLQLTLDGEVQQDEAVMVSVSNGAYLGEGLAVAPGARLADGLFDVVIVGTLSRRELLEFAAALRRGKHLDLPKVRCVRAHSVEIRRVHRSHRPLPIHADDHIAAHTPVHLEVVPAALRVLAPPFPQPTLVEVTAQ